MSSKDKDNPQKISSGRGGEQRPEQGVPGSAADAEIPDIPKATRTNKWLMADLAVTSPVEAVILNNLQYMMDEITDLKGMVAEVRVMALPALIGDGLRKSARSTTSMGSDENASSSRKASGQHARQPHFGPVLDLIERHEDILLNALSAHKAAGGKPLLVKSKHVSVEAEKYFGKLAEELAVDEQDKEEGLTENPILTELNALGDTQRTSLFTAICNRASKSKAVVAEGNTSDTAQPVLGKTRSAMKAKQEQSPSKKAAGQAADDDNNSKPGEPGSSQQSQGKSMGVGKSTGRKRKRVIHNGDDDDDDEYVIRGEKSVAEEQGSSQPTSSQLSKGKGTKKTKVSKD